ncbi:MAG: DUF1223 domain-containing protein [Pararhodobacter sp.]
MMADTGRSALVREQGGRSPMDAATQAQDGSGRCDGRQAAGRPQRLFSALAAAVALLLPQMAAAQWSMPDESPASRVVLELYTAQGCSACPPADAMMAELAMREDVIALSLHVDYWDYIGWADTFGRHAHTQRQTRYARRHGHSTIYTPQVVINGMEIMEGFRVAQVMEMLSAHASQPALVAIDLERRPAAEDMPVTALAAATAGEAGPVAPLGERLATGDGAVDRLHISARLVEEPMSPLALSTRAANRMPALLGPLNDDDDAPAARLHLVRYLPTAHVEIMAGENAGREVQYFNVVTEWVHIGNWDMRAPLEMAVEIEGSNPAVVILQEAGQGSILGAARLR